MGVRLYDPALGRFLEVGPVEGGSAKSRHPASQGKGGHNHGSTRVRSGWVYTIHLVSAMTNGRGDLTLGIARVTCRAR
jgi:hypothetical protein